MPQARDEAGNVWEVDAQGNAVRLLQPAGGGRIIPQQADPAARYEAPQAAATLAKTQVDTNVAQATAPAEIAKAQADARRAAAEAAKIESGRDMISATERANAITGYQSAVALEGIIADLEQKYREGPAKTKGVMGVADYLPTAANERFDRAANAARGIVGQALGFTGGQLNSAEEAKLNIGPYIPSASDKDGTIEDAIARLRELQAQAMQRSISILGGVPDENGNITPLSDDNRPNALTYKRTDGGRANKLEAAQGSTRAVPYPDEGQAEHDALVASLIAANGGRLDPQAYARARSQLDQKYGMQGDPASYASWAAGINEYLDNGGATIPTGIEAGQEEMGLVDQARNSLVNNSGGAALAGYLNSAALGAPEALTGGNMDALRDEYGLATLGGEIGGALTGTAGLGMAGRAGLRAMGRQGIQSQFGRNLATDVAYGGAYGGVTEGDPVTGAVLGGVGSTLGQGVGKVAGDAIGGVRLGEAAQRLRDRGVNLTTGRILGDTASAVEDKMVSLPFVGDMVRRRQGEGFRQFNEAAFREGGAPIGFAPSEVGEEGIGQFRQAVGNAYDSATAGQQVPFDQQFMTDMGGVYNNALRMPKDRQRELGSIIEARIAPITDTGQMTGEQYQQAMRALKQNRSKVPGRFEGFEQEYRDAVSGTMDALDGAMRRGGGDSVIEGLNSANAANKNLKILENASLDKAKIGTQTGEAEVFLPSQLIGAARQSEKKYGASSLKQLGKDGQAVLPSTVPNSGTADRLAMGGLILGGGGATGGFSAENPLEGGAAGLGGAAATMAALTALGSRRGQKALETILLDRPDALRQFGESVRRRKGLFGSAAVPIALTAQ